MLENINIYKSCSILGTLDITIYGKFKKVSEKLGIGDESNEWRWWMCVDRCVSHSVLHLPPTSSPASPTSLPLSGSPTGFFFSLLHEHSMPLLNSQTPPLPGNSFLFLSKFISKRYCKEIEWGSGWELRLWGQTAGICSKFSSLSCCVSLCLYSFVFAIETIIVIYLKSEVWCLNELVNIQCTGEL